MLPSPKLDCTVFAVFETVLTRPLPAVMRSLIGFDEVRLSVTAGPTPVVLLEVVPLDVAVDGGAELVAGVLVAAGGC